MKIHQLPPNVVSQISAGEVIERPVYAVKELIENAIDAGATAITVHIEECGLKRITVIDNGEGMDKQDLQESFKPHTTSKIAKADELAHIKTLGFRGEALASIAAISRLTISSKISGTPVGTCVVIKYGKREKISPVGMPSGTTVIVEHLFHNHPVRKKFLKSPRTEFRHILDLMTGYVLSYPQIHFVLTHNKRTFFDLPKSSDPTQRIEKILGKDVFSGFIPIEFTDAHITLKGYLAKPQFTTRVANKQFIFINNRLVSDKGISLTIKSAYGTLLANSVYPICLVYFTLPFEMVDVNVHPRKEQVAFVDPATLHTAVTTAVKQALARYDLTPLSTLDSLYLSDAVGSTKSYAGKLLKEKNLPWEISIKNKPDVTTISQIHKLYLLAITQSGFIMIDQHAAHERILFEQLLSEFSKEKMKHSFFQFPKPGIFDLSLSESEMLLENISLFQQLGWGLEHFKGTTFVISSLPVIFQDRDYVKLLREMLEDLQDDSLKNSVDEISKRMIAYLACRGAVKAGDTLTKRQAKDLVLQLEKTENNATCPHGRPTRVAVDLEQINRLFKR